MKRKWVVLALLLVPLLPAAVVLPNAIEADAWGLVTHMFIVNECIDDITNQSWAEAFDYYSPELIQGSTTPDQVWQDWMNHLYYPEYGNGTAPQAAQRWFQFARDNFTIGNWEDGFFAAGVMSHYAVDPCIPVHTGPNWSGHSAYEGDINDNLGILTLGARSENTVTNVSQLVVDAAVYSHQYYDYVYDAYPTSDTTAIETNSTVKTLTEACLTLALNNTLCLFYTLTEGINAPDVEIVYEHVAVFDFAHENDYVYGDGLTSVNQSLARLGYEMVIWEDPINTTALAGADLFVATCALDEYTTAELEAISTWAASGNKSILLTARGDFDAYTDIARPNQILEAIGSHIRVNDDNVYMLGTYQPWYNDLYDIPVAGETAGLTQDVESITMFSPTSLYFTDDDPVLPVIYADPSGYQTDQSAPGIDVIWDNTDDGEYGEQIPLAAVEEIGTLRLLVTGTTFFSNFDYGKDFDNVVFLENFLTWAYNRSIGIVPLADEVGPRVGGVYWNPANPDAGESVEFYAGITDPSGVASAELVIESVSGTVTLPMTASGDDFNATISGFTDEVVSVRIVTYDNEDNNSTRAYFSITWGIAGTTSTSTGTGTGGGIGGNEWMLIAVGGGVAVLALIAVIVIFSRRR
jgi:hypothetical protein